MKPFLDYGFEQLNLDSSQYLQSRYPFKLSSEPASPFSPKMYSTKDVTSSMKNTTRFSVLSKRKLNILRDQEDFGTVVKRLTPYPKTSFSTKTLQANQTKKTMFPRCFKRQEESPGNTNQFMKTSGNLDLSPRARQSTLKELLRLVFTSTKPQTTEFEHPAQVLQSLPRRLTSFPDLRANSTSLTHLRQKLDIVPSPPIFQGSRSPNVSARFRLTYRPPKNLHEQSNHSFRPKNTTQADGFFSTNRHFNNRLSEKRQQIIHERAQDSPKLSKTVIPNKPSKMQQSPLQTLETKSYESNEKQEIKAALLSSTPKQVSSRAINNITQLTNLRENVERIDRHITNTFENLTQDPFGLAAFNEIEKFDDPFQQEDSKENVKKKFKIVRKRLVEYLYSLKRMRLTPRQLLTAQVFTSEPYGRPASKLFFKAARFGDNELVKKMLEKDRYLVHDFDNIHQYALHWAVKTENLRLVRILIEAGADMDAKDLIGRTALYYALQGSEVEIVKYLLRLKCNPWSVESNDYMELVKDKLPFKMLLSKSRQLHIIERMLDPQEREAFWKDQEF